MNYNYATSSNSPIGCFMDSTLRITIHRIKSHHFITRMSKKIITKKDKLEYYNRIKIFEDSIKLKPIKKALFLGGYNIKQHKLWKTYQRYLKTYRRIISGIKDRIEKNSLTLFGVTILMNFGLMYNIGCCMAIAILIMILGFMYYYPESVVSDYIEKHRLDNIVTIISLFMFIKPLFEYLFPTFTMRKANYENW